MSSLADAVHSAGSPGSCRGWTPAVENRYVISMKILGAPPGGTNGGLQGSRFLGWIAHSIPNEACIMNRGALVHTPGQQLPWRRVVF